VIVWQLRCAKAINARRVAVEAGIRFTVVQRNSLLHYACSKPWPVLTCLHVRVLCAACCVQTVRYCSEVPADQAIPADALDSDGEVDVQDIFCATCRASTSTDDNDLILCDGPCNRCARAAK
jgi:hypothetical protein